MKRLLLAAAAALVLTGGAAEASVIFDTPDLYFWTVPTTGLYRIDVSGAQGSAGFGVDGRSAGLGGLGAEVAGDFQLIGGESLSILVGSQDQIPRLGFGGAGGGASYVALFGEFTPLAMAGGGGGGNAFSFRDESDNGGPGQAGPFGGDGLSLGGLRGDLFLGGGIGNIAGEGSGGAGLATNGAGAGGGCMTCTFRFGAPRFGGGGNGDFIGGGGGGGFSGGGGGGIGGGGGGGSYVSLNARPDNILRLSGVHAGQGLVTIEALASPGTEAPVPEPGIWSLTILGFGLLGATLRRRRTAAPCAS